MSISIGSLMGNLYSSILGSLPGPLGKINQGIGGFLNNLSDKALEEKRYQEQKAFQEQQFQFQKDIFNYQQQQNDLTRQREDNATQRRVADLQKAGLSPTLAAGSAAGATTVGASGSTVSSLPTNSNPRGLTPQSANSVDDFMQLANLSMQAKMNGAQVRNIDADTDLKVENKLLSAQNIQNLVKNQEKVQKEIDYMAELISEKKIDVHSKIYEEQIKRLISTYDWELYTSPEGKENYIKSFFAKLKSQGIINLLNQVKTAGEVSHILNESFNSVMGNTPSQDVTHEEELEVKKNNTVKTTKTKTKTKGKKKKKRR